MEKAFRVPVTTLLLRKTGTQIRRERRRMRGGVAHLVRPVPVAVGLVRAFARLAVRVAVVLVVRRRGILHIWGTHLVLFIPVTVGLVPAFAPLEGVAVAPLHSRDILHMWGTNLVKLVPVAVMVPAVLLLIQVAVVLVVRLRRGNVLVRARATLTPPLVSPHAITALALVRVLDSPAVHPIFVRVEAVFELVVPFARVVPVTLILAHL